MPVYPIFHRWSTRTLALVEADSLPQAVERAVGRGTPLLYADLKTIDAPRGAFPGADLRGADMEQAVLHDADLRGADLRTTRLVEADLRRADLRGADLHQAVLCGADLRAANLEGARLAGADLRGAQLFGARLRGAILDWRWSGVPLELLRQHRGGYQESSRVVADLAFHEETGPYSWLREIVRHAAHAGWVLRVLAEHIHPSDGAPELLRRLLADLPSGPAPQWAGPANETPDDPPRLWTRRRGTAPAPALRAV